MIVGQPDTLYEGGFFEALLDFPADFPNMPPVMTFKTPIWHPNGRRFRGHIKKHRVKDNYVFLYLTYFATPYLCM